MAERDEDYGSWQAVVIWYGTLAALVSRRAAIPALVGVGVLLSRAHGSWMRELERRLATVESVTAKRIRERESEEHPVRTLDPDSLNEKERQAMKTARSIEDINGALHLAARGVPGGTAQDYRVLGARAFIAARRRDG